MPDREFSVSTTETVSRTYTVMAESDKQARARLRLHFDDPTMLRDGIVGQSVKEELKHRRVVGASANPPQAAAQEKPGEAEVKGG